MGEKIEPGFYRIRGFCFLVKYDKKRNLNAEPYQSAIKLSPKEIEELPNLKPLSPEHIKAIIAEMKAEANFLERGLEQLAQDNTGLAAEPQMQCYEEPIPYDRPDRH